MTCPSCNRDLGPAVVKNIAICPNPECLRSVVLEDPPRLATGADTTVLTDRELKPLREARKAARG